MSTCQLDSSTGDNFLAPHHGEGCIHMPSPAPALNMQRVTQVLTTLGHHSDNYKDALKIMQQYGKGCDTSDLQSEAENEELPEKRNRKPVHRLGDSDDSEEDPGNSDLTSLGLASQLHRQTPPSRRVPARVIYSKNTPRRIPRAGIALSGTEPRNGPVSASICTQERIRHGGR
ncbi:uncharacterized protein LOC133665270 isoform X2 [Entelurus aequoreus]|uniref:uncharacterized protein LOC133665270 isoform X2 n=1 Tax=Entelurus aequoreus TaxID=161455 RepID=UPI002B1E3CD0|nr:uncharacterized protein LOC133665270 isoform X2 [Entelurus aequoreus]